MIRDVVSAVTPDPASPNSGKLFRNGIEFIELEVRVGPESAPVFYVKGTIKGPKPA